MSEIKRRPLGKGNRKVVEKVEYKGEYRIVGTVWSGKNKVGYGVVDVKTYGLRLFTSVQVHELLKRFKFENAELVNGEVHNTECSMDRLLKFDTNQNVIGNRGITILAKIFNDSDKAIGYRAMDANGKVVDIRETDLIRIAKQSEAGLLNAKVVPSDTGVFVSAIRGNFKRIERTITQPHTNTNIEDKLTTTANQEKAHKNYLNKVLFQYMYSIMSKGRITTITSKTAKKNAKIVSREFILPKYPELRNLRDAKAEDIILASVLCHIANEGGFEVKEKVRKYVGNGQYKEVEQTRSTDSINRTNNIILVKNRWGKIVRDVSVVDEEFLNTLQIIDPSSDVYDFFLYRNMIASDQEALIRDEGIMIRNPQIRSVVLRMRNDIKHRLERQAKIQSRPAYHTAEIDYGDTIGLAHMGYTVNHQDTRQKFNSIIYGKKKLRFIFEGLDVDGEEENYLIENINCFGDVEILRHIEKVRRTPELISFAFSNSYFDNPRIDVKDLWLQSLVFILSMHNPTMAKWASRKYDINPVFDIDQISRENFFLGQDDIVYYQSGLKFGKATTLKRNESWDYKDMNRIPEATFEALSMYVASQYEKPMPIKTPRVYA